MKDRDTYFLLSNRDRYWLNGVDRYTGEKDYEKYRGIKIIERTIGMLTEFGPAMEPLVREELRAHIDSEFDALGLIPGDYAGLRRLRNNLHFEAKDTLIHVAYPSIREFGENYSHILLASKPHIDPSVMFPAKGIELPDAPPTPLATDVAQNAQYDWWRVRGRGGINTLDYLYKLGQIMNNALKYKTTFEPEFGYKDIIKVGAQWSIENGSHRALTLRILGPEYVEARGMNRWIVVRREDHTV